MIKPKIGPCSECIAEGNIKDQIIVNKRHNLCQRHNTIRLHPQGKKPPISIKPSRFSESFTYPDEWGFTKELDMFLHIWKTRPHVSYLSGAPISSFHPATFLHILPKALNKYPLFRLNPDNVILGTHHEHHLV